MKIGVILAGGRSERMGGRDKAAALLEGTPLIDHVANKMSRQLDQIFIAGPPSQQIGIENIPDAPDGPPGPVGGVLSVLDWLNSIESAAVGFYTAPADGPFLPDDLVARLASTNRSAIASDGSRDHPTFAYWRCVDLQQARRDFENGRSESLMALADACGANRVIWRDPDVFFNVNTQEDLAKAHEIYNTTVLTKKS